MKKLFKLLIFCLFSCALHAQPGNILTNADAVADVFGDKNNAITKATIQTETDKMVVIQVEFKGFKEKDKSYKIRGTMMNSKKVKMEEFDVVEIDLDAKAGLADLEFVFKQKMTKTYPAATLETPYVQFAVLDKKGVGSSFGIESLGLDSKTFLYNYKKKWKLKPVVGTEVVVKLTAYKSAKNIVKS